MKKELLMCENLAITYLDEHCPSRDIAERYIRDFCELTSFDVLPSNVCTHSFDGITYYIQIFQFAKTYRLKNDKDRLERYIKDLCEQLLFSGFYFDVSFCSKKFVKEKMIKDYTLP
jgi:hypothetical protein